MVSLLLSMQLSLHKGIHRISKHFKVHLINLIKLPHHISVQFSEIFPCKLCCTPPTASMLGHPLLELHASHLADVVEVLLHGLHLPDDSVRD